MRSQSLLFVVLGVKPKAVSAEHALLLGAVSQLVSFLTTLMMLRNHYSTFTSLEFHGSFCFVWWFKSTALLEQEPSPQG